jgi:hypothetical protein
LGGFVYVLSNPSMPKLVKIGKSDRDPQEFRVHELYSTGVPEPFKVEYLAFVPDHHSLERTLHDHFKASRPIKGREFFEISVEEAIIATRQSSTVDFERVFFKTDEEIGLERKKREEEQAYQRRISEQASFEVSRQEKLSYKKTAEALSLEAKKTEAADLMRQWRFNFVRDHVRLPWWRHGLVTALWMIPLLALFFVTVTKIVTAIEGFSSSDLPGFFLYVFTFFLFPLSIAYAVGWALESNARAIEAQADKAIPRGSTVELERCLRQRGD